MRNQIELDNAVAAELAGRHVDLQVELPDLGRPSRVGDRLQRVGVAHGGHAPLVHQVQLDLLAHRRRILVEQPLTEHPGENIERPPYLLPVLAPILAADLDGLDVTAHSRSPLNE